MDFLMGLIGGLNPGMLYLIERNLEAVIKLVRELILAWY